MVNALADARARYQAARALLSLGVAAPAIGAAQAALAGPGVVLRGVLPGIARDAAVILERHAISVRLEPAAAAAPEGVTAALAWIRGRPAWLVPVVAAVFVAALGARGVRARPPAPSTLVAPTARSSKGGAPVRLSGPELAARSLPSTVAIRCNDSIGSGFFVGPQQVLTNAHVVCGGAEPLTIRTSDGREAQGRTLRMDQRLDLALVGVEGIAAPPLPFGDAGTLRVGDRVMLVGAPVGMEFSVTQGGVSSMERTLLGVAFLQTDAPVNPGNSGGPMLDEAGRVVGVVSLKRSDAEGIGLVLPINYAWTGNEALLPERSSSQGFRQILAKAEAEERREVAELQTSGQRPALIGVVAWQRGLVAQVLWPSASEPFTRTFDFELVRKSERICSLRGEVSRWQELKNEAGPELVRPMVKEWLTRHGFSADLWYGAVPLTLETCPTEQLGPGLVLEMRDADRGATRVVLK